MDEPYELLPHRCAEAKATGSKFYFTGKPCKHGHLSPRLTSNRRCYECAKLQRKKWEEENPEYVKDYRKRHFAENSERIQAAWGEWYRRNRDDQLRKKVKRYRENRDENLAYAEQYRAENPEKVKAATARWREENPEKIKAYQEEWYRINGKAYHAHRRSIPRHRIDNSMSWGIRNAIKERKDGKRWETFVDFTLDELMTHLESLFQPGMTWENYGWNGWHIDHKIPRSAFNYEDPSDPEFKMCWSLTNLQPLWQEDNLKKSNRIDDPLLLQSLITTREGTANGRTWSNFQSH